MWSLFKDSSHCSQSADGCCSIFNTTVSLNTFWEMFRETPTYVGGCSFCLLACASRPAAHSVHICIYYFLLSFQTLWTSSLTQVIKEVLLIFFQFFTHLGEREKNYQCSETPVVTQSLALEFVFWDDFVSNLCCSTKLKEGRLLASLSQDLTREFRFTRKLHTDNVAQIVITKGGGISITVCVYIRVTGDKIHVNYCRKFETEDQDEIC